MTDEPRVLTCALCGVALEVPAAADDATLEADAARWGTSADRETMAVLCDPCWRAFMAWAECEGIT